MRQVLTRVAVALALGAVALAPVGVAGGASVAGAAPAAVRAAATPTLSVTPATGLVSGQTITVSATGLAATPYLFTECAAGVVDTQTGCETGSAPGGTGSPFAGGSYSFSFPVERRVTFGGKRIDCATAPGACEVVAVAPEQGSGVVARAALRFDPNGTFPATTVTATPHTGLTDGQSIQVTGTGFRSGESINVSVCAAGDAVCTDGTITGTIFGSIPVTISAHVRVRDLDGNLTDCLAIACVVQAIDTTNPDYEAVAPITFDPGTRVPPAPSITVTPHTGLHHQDQVQVSGRNFEAGSTVRLGECAAQHLELCENLPVTAHADASGAFGATPMTLSRLATAFHPQPLSPTPYTTSIEDCVAIGCVVRAEGRVAPGEFPLYADAPVTFDASVPPPLAAAVTVTPSHGLPALADVAVHGTGFTPGETIDGNFCAELDHTASCNPLVGVDATVAADGTVDLTVPVQRRVFGSSTPVLDCVDADTTCYLRIDSPRTTEAQQIDLTFDPNAPLPQLTATVTPDHDLPYRPTVTVAGHGFAPGPVMAGQCEVSTALGTGFAWCKALGRLTADAGGDVSGSVELSRVLGPRDSPRDCAARSVSCAVVLGPQFGPDDTAIVPVHFDPTSQPPATPTLTVTPRTHLFDGQHVTVAGAHFTPGRLLGVTECRLGAFTLSGECDLSQMRLATTDADGSFSRRFVTKSVATLPSGRFDCTRTTGSCIIAAVNPADGEIASVLIGFDAPQLSVVGVGVREGTGGTTAAPVRVSLSEPDRNPITVHWQALPETAGSADYAVASGTVTIPAGRTSVTIDPRVVADALDEPTETFRVRVTEALGTKIVDPTGVVTIHDDDPTPTVSIRDTGRREDGLEAHAAVTLSAPSGRTVVVHYVTHDGSARAGTDYVRKDAQLVFAPGETRHVVRILLVNDRVHESIETFRVEIDRAEQATIGRGTATVTITDDD